MLSLFLVPIILSVILWMVYTTFSEASLEHRKFMFKMIGKSIIFMMVAIVIIACFVFIF